jgi:hypothetical protein
MNSQKLAVCYQTKQSVPMAMLSVPIVFLIQGLESFGRQGCQRHISMKEI